MVRFLVNACFFLAAVIFGLLFLPVTETWFPPDAPILVYGGAFVLGYLLALMLWIVVTWFVGSGKDSATAAPVADPVQVQLATLTESVKTLTTQFAAVAPLVDSVNVLMAQVAAMSAKVDGESGLRALKDFDPEMGQKLPDLRVLLAELAATPLPQIDMDALRTAETALQFLPRLGVLVDRYSVEELAELQKKLVHMNAILTQADELRRDSEGNDYDYAALADQLEESQPDIERVIDSVMEIKKAFEA